jgi:hypothetical protein
MDNIIKPSSLVDIENILTLAQRKVYNVLIEHSRQNIHDSAIFSLSVKTIREKAGTSLFESNVDVYEQIKSIADMPTMEANIFGKDKKYPTRIAVNLIAEVEYDKDHETISWSYPPFIHKMLTLLNTPDANDIGMYVKLPLAMQSKFSSKHSLALWEFCRSRFDEKRGYAESPFITIEELNKLFHCKYETWYRLNDKIVNKAIQDIHKQEPTYFINVVEQKVRHKVVAVKFIIQRRLSGVPLVEAQNLKLRTTKETLKTSDAQDQKEIVRNTAVEKFLATLSPEQQTRIQEEAERSVPEYLLYPANEREQAAYQLQLHINRIAIVEALINSQQQL